MSEKEPRPFVPSREELYGGQMDEFTEASAFYRNLAGRHDRGTDEAERWLQKAEEMKDHASRLRDVTVWDGAYRTSQDDGWAR